jgi:AraC family transcriptional regulator of adaptative response/methylated-DNA-[protein]-cysteine methyltransferase
LKDAFVYAVTSTGIYCRPGCKSRCPKRDNVLFFDAWPQAEAAGFRACLRCHPNQAGADPTVDALVRICRHIEANASQRLTPAELAELVGLSPATMQRRFKALLGSTPAQYQAACRTRMLKHTLKHGASVTRAIFAAGYGSTSRVYENASERLGMTPTEYQRGGPGVSINWAVQHTPLGWLLVAGTDRGICCASFGPSEAALSAQLRDEFPEAQLQQISSRESAALREWQRTLLAMAHGRPTDAELPLDVRGTAFQLRIWQALRAIPSGQTRAYGQLAEQLGMPGAARAVGRACATNPVALAIPCHRVLRGDGALGGYRWGLDRKRELLEREQGR